MKRGGKLNISATIYFDASSKITIKPGGKLILDGGDLTTICRTNCWKGIELWGNTNQNQVPVNGIYQQGIVQIINGGTIENAVCGIVTTGFDANGSEISGTHGGIILADNAVFKNCRTAVDFREYHNMLNGNEIANFSYFNLCTFTRDLALNDGSNFYAFTVLKTVYGIPFTGCIFQDLYATQYSQQGGGIVSTDSYFKVLPGCTNSQISPCPPSLVVRSTFNNLSFGIWANKVTTNRIYSVENSDFTKCGWSITNQGVNNGRITGSNFNLQTISGVTDVTGILLLSCTGFTVEENNFAASTGVNPYGIYANNTGTANNEIYKNTFTNNAIGILTASTCRNLIGTTGLQFKCNQFTGSNYYDICVTGTGADGVRTNQGASTLAAGNQFSAIVSGHPIYNFSNQSANLIRYYYYNTALQNPTISANINKYSVPINTCASHLGGGSGGGTLSMTPSQLQATTQEFADAKTRETAALTLYNSSIDGGNTVALVNDIETSWPSETWELNSELMSKAPYLSEDVLKAASENTDVLPNLLAFTIIKSNPDALKSTEFIESMNEKPQPLAGWMIDTLYNVRSKMTSRTNIENAIGFYSDLKDKSGFTMIRHIQADSSGVNHGLMQTWASDMEGFNTEIMLMNDLMETGDYQQAETILNAIPQKFKLKDRYLDEYNSFAELFGLLKTFYDSGKTLYELDSNDVQQVLQIATNGVGCGKIYACNIGSLYGNYCVQEIEAPLLIINERSLRYKTDESPVVNPEYVEVYPTPAREWVVIKWKLSANGEPANFEVLNSLGKSCMSVAFEGSDGEKVLDTRGWNAGMYYYKAVQQGRTIQTGKIVIGR